MLRQLESGLVAEKALGDPLLLRTPPLWIQLHPGVLEQSDCIGPLVRPHRKRPGESCLAVVRDVTPLLTLEDDRLISHLLKVRARLRVVLPPLWEQARQHEVDAKSSRPDVTALRRGATLNDLWRCIRHSASGGQGLTLQQAVGGVEINEPEIIKGKRHEDILRLDVPVHNLVRMQVVNSLHQRQCEGTSGLLWQPAARLSLHGLHEVTAVKVVHHHDGMSCEGQQVQGADDVRMVQPAKELVFLGGECQHLRIVRPHGLQRHWPAI
mmetsp:Transcript_86798/g.268740  ORF Transcript_86798/g.268740 Transcript_86798/m.268740 type:complete len:267 (+) Transcript_86798:444-1244(+)